MFIIVKNLIAVGDLGTEKVFQQKRPDGTEIILKLPLDLLEDMGFTQDQVPWLDLIIEPADDDELIE